MRTYWQCPICKGWFSTKTKHEHEEVKTKKEKKRAERVERYADEMPDNDVRFGESPDW